MYPAKFEYKRPKTLDETLTLMSDNKEAKIIAGGQSLLPILKLRLFEPDTLIDIGFIPELKQIKMESAHTLKIGAMVRHHEILEDSVVRSNVPLLSSTAENIADVQIRNRGTIGGSICEADPAADYLPSLFVLEAKVHLRTLHSERYVNIEEFIKGPFETALKEDEMLVGVEIEKNNENFIVEKYARRKADFAVASVAALAKLKSDGSVEFIRIATGATSEGPKRLRELEKSITGKHPNDLDLGAIIDNSISQIEMISDLHGSSEYRKYVLRGMLMRIITNLTSEKRA